MSRWGRSLREYFAKSYPCAHKARLTPPHSYSRQLTRRTMAVFYGQFKIDSFKKQMKENRKIEELILMFATHATAVLKKDPVLTGDAWKIELNIHIAEFVNLLRESLRN